MKTSFRSLKVLFIGAAFAGAFAIACGSSDSGTNLGAQGTGGIDGAVGSGGGGTFSGSGGGVGSGGLGAGGSIGGGGVTGSGGTNGSGGSTVGDGGPGTDGSAGAGGTLGTGGTATGGTAGAGGTAAGGTAGAGGATAGCTSSATCAPPLPYCDTAAKKCVECLGNPNCATQVATPACDLTTHVCVECTADANCTGRPGRTRCDVATNTCVPCLGDGDCTGGRVCDTATHACVAKCTSGANCAPPTPQCDTTAGICVQCLGDANCTGVNGRPHCAPTTEQCVECVADANCPAGETCTNNRCGCPSSMTNCSGGGGVACRDLANDPRNCAQCGNPCGDRQVCTGSQCTCRPGLTTCAAVCADTKSDPEHCGGCTGAGTACAAGQMCLAGKCQAASGGCKAPTPTACTGAGGRVACVNENTDPLHCGDCGTACAVGEICAAGNCVRYRPATSCNQCPCNAVCGSFGAGAFTCCANPSASGPPMCVEGTTPCP
jgi:Cys-rich repeat protein